MRVVIHDEETLEPITVVTLPGLTEKNLDRKAPLARLGARWCQRTARNACRACLFGPVCGLSI